MAPFKNRTSRKTRPSMMLALVLGSLMVGITEGDEVNDQLHSSHELLDKSKAMPEPVGGEVDEEVDGTEEAPGSDKVMPNPYTTTAIPQESSYTSDPSLVQNTMLHYGEFCGPGPKLLPGCMAPVAPVDVVDSVCMAHDQGWCKCFEERLNKTQNSEHEKTQRQKKESEQTPADELGHHDPSDGNGSKAEPMKPHPLLLSTRFLTIPAPLYRRLFDESFRECIRQADQSLLKDMDALEAAGSLPEWWDKWTAAKFHQFLQVFRRSVARDNEMRQRSHQQRRRQRGQRRGQGSDKRRMKSRQNRRRRREGEGACSNSSKNSSTHDATDPNASSTTANSGSERNNSSGKVRGGAGDNSGGIGNNSSASSGGDGSNSIGGGGSVSEGIGKKEGRTTEGGSGGGVPPLRQESKDASAQVSEQEPDDGAAAKNQGGHKKEEGVGATSPDVGVENEDKDVPRDDCSGKEKGRHIDEKGDDFDDNTDDTCEEEEEIDDDDFYDDDGYLDDEDDFDDYDDDDDDASSPLSSCGEGVSCARFPAFVIEHPSLLGKNRLRWAPKISNDDHGQNDLGDKVEEEKKEVEAVGDGNADAAAAAVSLGDLGDVSVAELLERSILERHNRPPPHRASPLKQELGVKRQPMSNADDGGLEGRWGRGNMGATDQETTRGRGGGGGGGGKSSGTSDQDTGDDEVDAGGGGAEGDDGKDPRKNESGGDGSVSVGITGDIHDSGDGDNEDHAPSTNSSGGGGSIDGIITVSSSSSSSSDGNSDIGNGATINRIDNEIGVSSSHLSNTTDPDDNSNDTDVHKESDNGDDDDDDGSSAADDDGVGSSGGGVGGSGWRAAGGARVIERGIRRARMTRPDSWLAQLRNETAAATEQTAADLRRAKNKNTKGEEFGDNDSDDDVYVNFNDGDEEGEGGGIEKGNGSGTFAGKGNEEDTRGGAASKSKESGDADGDAEDGNGVGDFSRLESVDLPPSSWVEMKTKNKKAAAPVAAAAAAVSAVVEASASSSQSAIDTEATTDPREGSGAENADRPGDGKDGASASAAIAAAAAAADSGGDGGPSGGGCFGVNSGTVFASITKKPQSLAAAAAFKESQEEKGVGAPVAENGKYQEEEKARRRRRDREEFQAWERKILNDEDDEDDEDEDDNEGDGDDKLNTPYRATSDGGDRGGDHTHTTSGGDGDGRDGRDGGGRFLGRHTVRRKRDNGSSGGGEGSSSSGVGVGGSGIPKTYPDHTGSASTTASTDKTTSAKPQDQQRQPLRRPLKGVPASGRGNAAAASPSSSSSSSSSPTSSFSTTTTTTTTLLKPELATPSPPSPPALSPSSLSSVPVVLHAAWGAVLEDPVVVI